MKIFDIEILVSAIVWLPYSLLLLYLFYEHIARSHRNLQSAILFLLFVGSVFRATWFWFYFSFVNFIYSEVVNRIAMLCQFSGLTVLMLMWSRAISIAKLTDTAYNETSKNLIAISKDTVAARDRKSRVQRYQEANQTVLNKISGETSFTNIYVATAVINFCVWSFVLGSLADQSKLWYNINIIGIAVTCMVLAVLTLVVGVRVSLALHIALSPVYLNNEGATGYNQEQKLKCVCMGRYGATCEYVLGCCGLCSLYAFIFNYHQSDTRQGLQMQREVLKVILSVSALTSFFFLIRSFVFLYRPVVEEYAGRDEYSNIVDGAWAYPYFYYQVPELIPNLVIALGISPPNGILRQFAKLCVFAYHYIVHKMYGYCGVCGESDENYTQQSVFTPDGSDGSFSTPRASFRADAIAAASSRQSSSLPPSEVPDFVRPSLTSRPPLLSSVSAQRTADHPAIQRTTGANASTSAVDIMERGGGGGGAGVEKEVLSPVHARSANIPIGGSSVSEGAASRMIAYQNGSHTQSQQSQHPQQQSLSMGGKSSTTVFTPGAGRTPGNTGSYGGSLHSAGSLTSRSPKTKRNVAVSLRKNAARGTWEAHIADTDGGGDLTGEDEDWVRQRRDSAEMAEMLYRINSFSTMSEGVSDGFSDNHTAPSSLTNSSDLGSVESNTILNSRRQNIAKKPLIIPGGGINSKKQGQQEKTSSSWGWFA